MLLWTPKDLAYTDPNLFSRSAFRMCKSKTSMLLLLSWVLSGPSHFLRRCQTFLRLLLPETSSTEFPSWQDFLQIPRWDTAAPFSNVGIALTYLANHSPCIFVNSDLACLAWLLVAFLFPVMTSMSGCYLPSISFRLTE